jgi:hypothetical protein
MTEISIFRINLLRIAYLILVIGLGLNLWPAILDPAQTWELKQGLVVALLGAIPVLALLGIRYPLQMLPLLFFEMAWKAIWLIRMALPLVAGHRLDAATAETLYECLPIFVFPIFIPWRYVFRNYFQRPGDPWRAPRALAPQR